MLTSVPSQTALRIAAMDRYFREHVMQPGTLTCSTAADCQSSHTGDFIAGQLHHIGTHYDLIRNGTPLRVVVVGQEYGHPPPFVTLAQRRHAVLRASGMESRFKAGGGLRARNSHMRGCTSLLRLIFGLGLGVDHNGEFLDLDGAQVHVFDCFALVNFLLCSALAAGDGSSDLRSIGGKRGRSTPTMRANCSSHFRATLETLEPTLVIAQGYGVRSWIARSYRLPAQVPDDGIEPLRIGGSTATLISFSHPSARGALNWGLNENRPYLLHTVAPTITRVLDVK